MQRIPFGHGAMTGSTRHAFHRIVFDVVETYPIGDSINRGPRDAFLLRVEGRHLLYSDAVLFNR